LLIQSLKEKNKKTKKRKKKKKKIKEDSPTGPARGSSPWGKAPHPSLFLSLTDWVHLSALSSPTASLSG
jgi:hypothetical protein